MTETSFSVAKAKPGVAATTLEDLPDDIDYRHATGFGEFDRVLW